VVGVRDLVEDDRLIADARSNQRIAARLERAEQQIEAGSINHLRRAMDSAIFIAHRRRTPLRRHGQLDGMCRARAMGCYFERSGASVVVAHRTPRTLVGTIEPIQMDNPSRSGYSTLYAAAEGQLAGSRQPMRPVSEEADRWSSRGSAFYPGAPR